MSLASKHQFDILLYEWVKARWLSWKEAFVHKASISSASNINEKILCITHDFATTREPIFLTKEEIIQYNLERSEDLIEISQNHTELKAKIENPAVDEKITQAAFIIQNFFKKHRKAPTVSTVEQEETPKNQIKQVKIMNEI